MVYKIPSTMVRGYCTLFLVNNGQWSGGVCPLTVVHGTRTRVQGGVGGIDEVLFCFHLEVVIRRVVNFRYVQINL